MQLRLQTPLGRKQSAVSFSLNDIFSPTSSYKQNQVCLGQAVNLKRELPVVTIGQEVTENYKPDQLPF